MDLGSIVSAGANILGGFFGKSSADKANEINRQNGQENLAFQREAAMNGVTWKVADAQRAGVSPLVALGAQTFNPSPVSVGATADNSFGTGIAAAGQDIGRAINSTRSSQARMDAFTKTSQELTLQKMGLENELLASQVRKSNQVGISPPMPVAGKQPQLVDGQSATNLSTVGGFPVKDDDITSKAETYPQHRQIRILGVPVKTNPHSADAQDIEDRYGDLVEEVAGVGNIGADALYTIYKWLQSKQRAARGRSDLGKLRNSADEYFERR